MSEDIERKRAFLKRKIGFDKYVPLSLSDLTYREKVMLGTLIQAGIEDDYKTLSPLNDCNTPIFPTDEILDDVVKELKDKHILEFSPLSNLDCFELDYENDTFEYYWAKVHYQINIKEIIENKKVVEELLLPQKWMLNYPDNNSELWDEIVYWEALSLFDYILEEYNIRYEIGKETRNFFWTVTKQLPISQVYSIIYQSGKNIAASANNCRMSEKYRIFNSILQKMKNTRDNILSGKYQRWDYGRPSKYCPQSIVSQYYFNNILGIYDKYWTMLSSNFFIESKTKDDIF